MKEETKHERQDERVVEMLTPKHAPRCKMSFKAPDEPKRITLWRYVRTAGVAAIVVLGVFVGIRMLAPDEARAAQIIDRAMEELQEVRSCRMQLTFSLVGRQAESANVTYRILRTEKGDFSRIDTQREESGHQTTFLYTPDSMKIWSDGRLQYALPRQEMKPDFDTWITLDVVMGKFNDDKKHFSIIEETDETVTLRSNRHAYKYEYTYEGVFSKATGRMKSFSGYIEDDKDGFTTFVQCDNIDYNIPLTEEEICKGYEE